MNTLRGMYEEISNRRKELCKKVGLELTELGMQGKENKLEFSFGWFKSFIITFNPKTIGVKYTNKDKETKEIKSISKQYPLDKSDILDTVISLM